MTQKDGRTEQRVYLVPVTETKIYRVTIGGLGGSIRLEDEDDRDAAQAIVEDHHHLHEAMLPEFIKLEERDLQVEEVREQQPA